jgi:hypothetical protein
MDRWMFGGEGRSSRYFSWVSGVDINYAMIKLLLF